MRDNPPVVGSAQRRVAAPMDAVWLELGLTPLFLSTMPLDDVRVDPDESSASFTARLGIGPLGLSRGGTGAVIDARKPERIVFEMSLDDHSWRSVHTVELTDGGEDETVLTYNVELQSAQPMPRLRRLLSGVFDDHVRAYADQVSTTAARHWKAELAMGLRDPDD